MATIYAWSGALRKRGEMDKLPELMRFADQLEGACIDTLMDGVMTKDLTGLVVPGTKVTAVNSAEFIAAIRERLEKRLA
jgi:isocitrate dehydrogenase